jgi:hypothetical protein
MVGQMAQEAGAIASRLADYRDVAGKIYIVDKNFKPRLSSLCAVIRREDRVPDVSWPQDR